MPQEFHADTAPSKRFAYAGRLLLFVAALTAFNIWSGWTFWSTVEMALFGLALVAFAATARSKWGDKLELLPDAINVYKRGEKQHCIQASEITSLSVKAGSIAVLWQHAGKKNFIVLGRECFSDAIWAQLSVAMRALR
jgi:hypothetical protein